VLSPILEVRSREHANSLPLAGAWVTRCGGSLYPLALTLRPGLPSCASPGIETPRSRHLRMTPSPSRNDRRRSAASRCSQPAQPPSPWNRSPASCSPRSNNPVRKPKPSRDRPKTALRSFGGVIKAGAAWESATRVSLFRDPAIDGASGAADSDPALPAARAEALRQEMRDWGNAHPERTRRLIERGGLVQKVGLVEMRDDCGTGEWLPSLTRSAGQKTPATTATTLSPGGGTPRSMPIAQACPRSRR
jgi:hypothetical protein